MVVPLTPDEVQTVGVVDVTVTGKPDDDVADTLIGGVPRGWLIKPLKVITWVPWPIANVCVTCTAAVKFALPAWLAAIVQLPTATGVNVAPETVQTSGVVLV